MLCLFCTCDFIGLLCHIRMKRKPVLSKKIKCDFLHGRKNFVTALKRDKRFALFQSSPKINRMLIKRLICMQFYNKSSLDSNPQFPRSPLGTRGLQTRSHRQIKYEKRLPTMIMIRSITEWNSLPADLVNCKSLSDFKLNLGKHVK